MFLLFRYESFFFSGSPGCWGCLGQERRSQGRQSWSRTRWRRWTWRRTPPSPSWRTSSTWTMTSALLRSTITSSHRRPTSPKAHKATLLVFSGSICYFYLAANIVQALSLTPPHYEESFTKIIFIFSQISSLCFLLQIFEEKIPISFLNIYSNIFLRVSLTPPHYEESFSSSGVHRELSSILKEIRVKPYCNLHIFAIFACLIILGEHILSIKLSSQKFVITGDHGQAKGRRRRCRHWERLEVCGHGARQALPHHLHRLHCHRHCRRPRCRAARYRNLDTNSIYVGSIRYLGVILLLAIYSKYTWLYRHVYLAILPIIHSYIAEQLYSHIYLAL